MADIPEPWSAGASSSSNPPRDDTEAEEVGPVTPGCTDDDGETTDGVSFSSRPPRYVPFRDIPPMRISPDLSLRNPEVGIPLIKSALLPGDWAAMAARAPSTPRELAQRILSFTANDVANRMEVISAVKHLVKEVRELKGKLEEEKLMKEEAEKKVELFEFDCNSLKALLVGKDQRIAELSSSLKVMQEHVALGASTALEIGPTTLAAYRSSDAFRAELDATGNAAVKRFKDTLDIDGMARALCNEELRKVMARIVEDVHHQCPSIDFMKVEDIGAFGEFHLAMTGKRKRDDTGEGSAPSEQP